MAWCSVKKHRDNFNFLPSSVNLPRCIPSRDLHVAFKSPYLYQSATNYAGGRQHSYKINEMQILVTLTKAKLNTENIKKRLKLGGGEAYDRSSV
jgi:hypothetical protein